MDDLSGLDWSSKQGGPQPKQPALNLNATYSGLRPTLSPMGSTGSGQHKSLSSQASSSSAPKQTQNKAPDDSFSNLMQFGPPKSKQTLSLAERQAQLEEEKRQKAEEQRKLSEAQFGTAQQWDSLGSRGGGSPNPFAMPTKRASAASPSHDDDDLFAAFNKDTKVDKASHYPPPESSRSTPASAAPLDLSDPSAWKPTKPSMALDSYGEGMDLSMPADDDDPFGLNEMRSSRTQHSRITNDVDDDILGDLGRPVEQVRREKPRVQQPEAGKPIEDDDDSSSSDESRPPTRRPTDREDLFDKAVAQLVDYGFAADDARRGLTESGQGLNVQAAANWLLDDAHKKSKAKAQGRGDSHAPSRPERGSSRSPGSVEADLAKSAAAVGNTLFKTANSLWKTGSKKVQRAYADFQQDGGDPSQPKWMRDAQAAHSPGASTAQPVKATDEAMMLETGGRPAPPQPSGRPQADMRHSEAVSHRGASPAQSLSSRTSPVPRWQQPSPAAPSLDTKSRLNRLATDDDSFSTYSSPNRRRKAATPSEPKKPDAEPDLLFNSEAASTQAPRSSQALPIRSPQSPAQLPPKRTQPVAKPTPRPTRQVPTINASVLASSTKNRLTGTAHFKRGDYASAHASYTSALSGVPENHPLTILLLTNRALTCLKTGEPKQAVDDADNALRLIGPSNGQGESVTVTAEDGQEENRDLRELYGKALARKAEALEQMEKWADAGAVWQLCVEGGLGGHTAIKGRQRCQNALAPKPKPVAKPITRSRPTATPTSKQSSEAVTRLREANQAAAREDDEKFALSEKVDAKISAWRDGKRDNLRALLGSLDTVLWEGSGWKKVGLHELVMANKVKIVYMKAIAKTHPDKLAQDASTEVRLIAGLVFSTLNESWDKFKADNGL